MLYGLSIASIILVIIYSMLSLFSHESKAIKLNQLHLAAQTVRNNLETHLRNDEAWNLTIDDTQNEGFNCFNTTGACQSIALPDLDQTGGGPVTYPTNTYVMVIRNAGNEVIYSSDAANGFNLAGEPCNRFSKTEPDPNCPLKFQVYWEPVCTGPCPTPSVVRLRGVLEYAPLDAQRVPFNPVNYRFTIDRPSLK